ncbi:hypothetical protein ACHAQJ_010602 [Trichoderma viride]
MDSTSDNNTPAALVGSAVAEQLIAAHVSHLVSSSDAPASASSTQHSSSELLAVGLAALDAFLQTNVTGPVLPSDESTHVEKLFIDAWNSSRSEPHDSVVALHQLRRACLKYLEVDGVVPYAYIPHLELFSLAKYILVHSLAAETKDVFELPLTEGTLAKRSLAWEKLRLNVWHYKIITQPSLGSGSNFTKSSQWSDIPTLATQISNQIEALRKSILDNEIWATEETWTRDEKALFLVEAANNYILLGRYDKAKETLDEAAKATGVAYALSGALGKRTKFQEHNISQLVVFARSASEQDVASIGEGKDEEDDQAAAKPDSLKLNNDTLLEEIQFAKETAKNTPAVDTLPSALSELSPDDQPQLSALDEIILLTEATIKDAFSPIDTLTSEQILPFAVRVLTDKSVNWQIYTQALLVRSRIEIHRSRTVERGVLQLQAVADQVLTDTTFSTTTSKESQEKDESDIPAIQVTAPGQTAAPVDESKPTSFLPAATNSESAPAHVRLRYIHALSTPPRWHLESELAYAWAGVGSMTSALEIFKRLKLWAEVALCYASSAAAEDEDGRGSGGEAKAKGIIRWRLFNKTGVTTPSLSEPEDEVVGLDVSLLKAADFSGAERQPPPPNAARLWCILGDLENDPAHYERAWEISKHRYARAQRSLGEHYLGQKDLSKALDAYKKATSVNRLSPDMWGRLGDISLRLGQFEDAAEAYSRSISSANDTDGGEGARTWSNLGSALYSLYSELTAPGKAKEDDAVTNGNAAPPALDDEDEDDAAAGSKEKIVSRDPSKLLTQSLAAYKKGASIAHDNWRIWDNVVTLGSRIYPIPTADMVLAITHIIRIRKSEDALDINILSALLQDAVLSKDKPSASNGIYEPPRGSIERLLTRLIEEEITPLITTRSDLWTLVSRLRAWRCDYAGAIDASERAWRAAVGSSGSSGSGLLPGESASGSADWTSDEAAWAEVVKRTDELVSVLENWGPDVDTIGQKWKGKARSAVRSVMGRAKATWEDSQGWKTLENLMEGLKIDRS